MPRFNSQQGNQAAEHWTAELDLRQQFDTINLDVLFLLDATGSMADEINAIQTTIFDVADRIDQLPGRQDVRFGLVAYRDRGDEYVTRTFDFEADVRDFSDNLERIEANGGGDYPEALNEGLHQALYNVQWRGEGTVRLIFLIADAPPHLDYGQDADYAVDMETAASSAIKIFPIASSGLDDQGEYVFRQLAQFTQGRFIFLTYDSPSNGGQSGDITTHHVDSYSVNTLDDLLVRLVTEELAFQNPELVQGQ
jgi:Mg-chelatase subunit ChlD